MYVISLDCVQACKNFSCQLKGGEFKAGGRHYCNGGIG